MNGPGRGAEGATQAYNPADRGLKARGEIDVKKRHWPTEVWKKITRAAHSRTSQAIRGTGGELLRDVSHGNERNVEDRWFISPKLMKWQRNLQEGAAKTAAKASNVDVFYKGYGNTDVQEVAYASVNKLPKNPTPEQAGTHRITSIIADVASAVDLSVSNEVHEAMPRETHRVGQRQAERELRHHPDVWIGQNQDGSMTVRVLRYESDNAEKMVQIDRQTGQPVWFEDNSVEDKLHQPPARVSVAAYTYFPSMRRPDGTFTEERFIQGDKNDPDAKDILGPLGHTGQWNASTEQHMRFRQALAGRLNADSTDLVALQIPNVARGTVSTYIEAVQGSGVNALRGMSDEAVRELMLQRINYEGENREGGVVLLRGLESLNEGSMQGLDALRRNGIATPDATTPLHPEMIEGRERMVARIDAPISPETLRLYNNLPTEYARSEMRREFGEQLNPEAGQLYRVRLVPTERFRDDQSAEREHDERVREQINEQNVLYRSYERAIRAREFNRVPLTAYEDPALRLLRVVPDLTNGLSGASEMIHEVEDHIASTIVEGAPGYTTALEAYMDALGLDQPTPALDDFVARVHRRNPSETMNHVLSQEFDPEAGETLNAFGDSLGSQIFEAMPNVDENWVEDQVARRLVDVIVAGHSRSELEDLFQRYEEQYGEENDERSGRQIFTELHPDLAARLNEVFNTDVIDNVQEVMGETVTLLRNGTPEQIRRHIARYGEAALGTETVTSLLERANRRMSPDSIEMLSARGNIERAAELKALYPEMDAASRELLDQLSSVDAVTAVVNAVGRPEVQNLAAALTSLKGLFNGNQPGNE